MTSSVFPQTIFHNEVIKLVFLRKLEQVFATLLAQTEVDAVGVKPQLYDSLFVFDIFDVAREDGAKQWSLPFGGLHVEYFVLVFLIV